MGWYQQTNVDLNLILGNTIGWDWIVILRSTFLNFTISYNRIHLCSLFLLCHLMLVFHCLATSHGKLTSISKRCFIFAILFYQIINNIDLIYIFFHLVFQVVFQTSLQIWLMLLTLFRLYFFSLLKHSSMSLT